MQDINVVQFRYPFHFRLACNSNKLHNPFFHGHAKNRRHHHSFAIDKTGLENAGNQSEPHIAYGMAHVKTQVVLRKNVLPGFNNQLQGELVQARAGTKPISQFSFSDEGAKCKASGAKAATNTLILKLF